jgi:signal peptidase I
MDPVDETGELPGAPFPEPANSGDFDPLFSSDWSAGPLRAARTEAADDYLFGYEPLPSYADEKPFEQITLERYPDRYVPTVHERLTELQRQLREGVVVVPRHERRLGVTIRELAETLLLAALIFLAVRASFQNFRVQGGSMQPSLEDGEYLIVNKLSYAELDTGFLDWLPFVDGDDDPLHLWDEPSLGDVVVFAAPTSPDRDFIKRVIGTPGDTVQIDAQTHQVIVNGEVLDEPYIQGQTTCGESCTYEVPPAGSPESHDVCGSDECYFVMGDNRQNSSDSRQGWMVPRENIIGKAMITYWHEGGPNIGLAPNHDVDHDGQAEASSD